MVQSIPNEIAKGYKKVDGQRTYYKFKELMPNGPSLWIWLHYDKWIPRTDVTCQEQEKRIKKGILL